MLVMLLPAWVGAAEITDMAGRKVVIPDRIERVFGSAPPLNVLQHAVSSERMAGLSFRIEEPAKKFFPPHLQSLPVAGGIFGLGQQMNAETVLALRPDIALAWKTVRFLAAAAGLTSMEPERYALLNLTVEIRLPRVLAAFWSAPRCRCPGASFQALFRNPLVSPGLLGVLAGASAGAALGIILGGNWLLVQASAFLTGLAAVGIGVGIAHLFRGGSLVMLILGGIAGASDRPYPAHCPWCRCSAAVLSRSAAGG